MVCQKRGKGKGSKEGKQTPYTDVTIHIPRYFVSPHSFFSTNTSYLCLIKFSPFQEPIHQKFFIGFDSKTTFYSTKGLS